MKGKKIVFVILVFMSFLCIKSCNTYVQAKTGTYHWMTILEDSSQKSDAAKSLASNIVGSIASTIFDWVTKFVVTVSNLVENLIIKLEIYLFNVYEFPWEDYIVYNVVPYLDINFFNPSAGSLFSNGTLGEIVKTIYFSLLTLSLTVLGIGVSIVALRLAISSIASEKAKYKESIMKCLYTVIMLFSVHILISFIFYLNESICNAASTMLISLTSEASSGSIVDDIDNADFDQFRQFLYNNTHPEYALVGARVQNAIDNGLDNWGELWGIVKESAAIFGDDVYNTFMTLIKSGEPLKVVQQTLDDSEENELFEKYWNIVNEYSEALKIGDYLASHTAEYRDDRLSGMTYITIGGYMENGSNYMECKTAAWALYNDVYNIVTAESLDDFKSLDRYGLADQNTKWFQLLEKIFVEYELGEEYSENDQIVTTLAANFKADGNKVTNDDANDNNYVGAYLYAIMLVQSIMLLITYIKRLFYVTILAILAPVVIIYDFFMGNSNKVFTTWIKEFCSLVFVQAMQALLMTVMLAMVAKLYLASKDDSNMQQAMGIYAIIIMVLIPKVELLVKRIFGLGSGVMDDSMMGGKKSLTKGMVALGLGRRVLDNGAKIVGGLGAAAIGAGSAKFGAVNKKTQIAENNKKALEAEGLTGGSQSGSLSGGSSASRPLTQAGLMDAIRNAGKEDPEEAAERAKHENAQAIRGGLKQAASGLVETAGAIGGASLGAVYSLGTGGDDLASNMVAGAGIGDAVGEGLTNATLGTANRIADWNYERKQLNKKVKDSEDKLKAANEYKKTISDAKKVQPPTGTKSTKRAIKRPTSNTTTKTKSQNPAGNKNTSRSLSSNSKQYYDKALEAKSKGNMDAYKQNRAIAAGMMKAEKKAASKASASTKAKTYTKDNTTQLKNSTLADINRVKRNKENTSQKQVEPKQRNSSASDVTKMAEMKKNSAMKKNLENSSKESNKS